MVEKHQLHSERWSQPFFVISSSLTPPPRIIPQTHLCHHFPCHYFHRFSLLGPSRPLSSRIWSVLEQHRRGPNRRRWQDGGRPVKPQGCVWGRVCDWEGIHWKRKAVWEFAAATAEAALSFEDTPEATHVSRAWGFNEVRTRAFQECKHMKRDGQVWWRYTSWGNDQHWQETLDDLIHTGKLKGIYWQTFPGHHQPITQWWRHLTDECESTATAFHGDRLSSVSI